MPKEFLARRLDVQAFAEEGASLHGQQPLSAFGRLLAETEGRGADSLVDWSAQGELRNPRHLQPQVWLHLRARAQLQLTCQRCLQPVETPVEVDGRFRFVADEAAAAAEDDQSEEDVLATSRAFDLAELLEDELLMALPVAPRHEVCPEPLPMSAADPGAGEAAPVRENPFAMLQKLRQGKAE
ncbi:YceD family protein [Ramlibacter tataouinensis]|uniref:Large ribosomal RNA subunit accumulation protein YceD n=1 Tax=Ramlibacter tataouinensis (strain ATCC BAA-407 / DSM 14655 / LMG 21543 / TTB310) TaxID=365046 RepID=F5Y5S6_RAMTT|nr:YceD family protein [Ramlibacter tataouinensis]AEG93960.1 conserved hypothetical protein [Ramlibacter tataouinensis TTB310]